MKNIYSKLGEPRYKEYELALRNLGRLRLNIEQAIALDLAGYNIEDGGCLNTFSFVLTECARLEMMRHKELGELLNLLAEDPKVPFTLSKYLSDDRAKYKGLVSHLFGGAPLDEVKILNNEHYQLLDIYPKDSDIRLCLENIIIPYCRLESLQLLEEIILDKSAVISHENRIAYLEDTVIRLASLRTFLIIPEYRELVANLTGKAFNTAKRITA